MEHYYTHKKVRSLWNNAFLAILVFAAGIVNAQAVIVDLNARSNSDANPVYLTLSAGTYNVTPIGTADGGAFNAWNAWGNTTCGDPTGCSKTAPTSVTGWLTVYRVISENLTAVNVDGMDLTPSAPLPFVPYFYVDGANTHYNVDDGKVYMNELDALAHIYSSTFTVDADGLVAFSIPDIALGDNLGGISLLVTAVPEPSTFVLLGFGLAGIFYFRRRKTTSVL